ncbi:MAG TPA: hypothetical protein VLC28_13975, partial [Flavitalea sp.]|nr:hypothetical protein [Flavitalea sp.]
GSFTVTQPSNTYPAIQANSKGSGSAIRAFQGATDGTGPGMDVFMQNPASTADGLYVHQFALGRGATFEINNASNNNAGIFSTTNGTGAAIMAVNNGTGNGSYLRKNGATPNSAAMWADNFGNDGYGAIAQNISTTNPKPALFAEAAGTGSSIWALKSTGDVSGNALLAENDITSGSAGKFQNSNSANTSAAVDVTTNSNGGGSAILANQTGVGDAIFANAVSGSAGNFQNSTVGNNASALFSITNAPTGFGLGTMNTANGNAFAIFQGGMQTSTFEVTTGTTIATRAAAYRITTAGPSFTLGFSSSTGDMFMVYNDTAGTITFEGVSIPSGTGKIVINFNSGSYRGL